MKNEDLLTKIIHWPVTVTRREQKEDEEKDDERSLRQSKEEASIRSNNRQKRRLRACSNLEKNAFRRVVMYEGERKRLYGMKREPREAFLH